MTRTGSRTKKNSKKFKPLTLVRFNTTFDGEGWRVIIVVVQVEIGYSSGGAQEK